MGDKLRFFIVFGATLAILLVSSLADQETLNAADSNTITVLDPRKLQRPPSNINAAAINSLTGSSSTPSADGKSDNTTLIFATHVTEPAPQLETQPELNNQLGQPVYLQAQPQQQPQQHHSHHQPAPQHQQFLYPQPAPLQGSSLSNQAPLNAPGASPPYLLHPGYGVQYVQYVPRPVVMPNYPPPPSVFGQHPAHYSSLPFVPPVPSHHQPQHHHYAPHHVSGIPPSAQFILPPPPGHHTIPSLNNYGSTSAHNSPSPALQSAQNQPQPHQNPSHQHQHQHHPQTHFLAGPPPQPQSVPPTSTYVSGSAVGQQQAPSHQAPQNQSPQGQASSQASSYLTYSSPSHHYHSSQQQLHQSLAPQPPNPSAQPSNLIQSHVTAPQQHQPLGPQQPTQQQLIGSYSHQAPLYSYVQQPQQAPRFGGSTDPFLNTNEYLPSVQYDNSQFRAIKRNSKV